MGELTIKRLLFIVTKKIAKEEKYMTLVEELKERVMSNGRLSREEACALFREPLEELSIIAKTGLISVRSSMEKAAGVLRTASIARNPPSIIQRQ